MRQQTAAAIQSFTKVTHGGLALPEPERRIAFRTLGGSQRKGSFSYLMITASDFLSVEDVSQVIPKQNKCVDYGGSRCVTSIGSKTPIFLTKMITSARIVGLRRGGRMTAALTAAGRCAGSRTESHGLTMLLLWTSSPAVSESEKQLCTEAN